MKKRKQGFIIKMNKKGISEIISWVLLIGFAVSLAVIVTTWTLKNTEKTTEGVVKMVTGDMRCSEVYINLEVDCVNKQLKAAMNNGKFKISTILIRAGSYNDKREIDLMPNDKIDLNIGFNSESIEVVPLIKVDRELIGCSDKVKEVRC